MAYKTQLSRAQFKPELHEGDQEMKTVVRTSLLAIIALALLAPAVAQDTPGLSITWTTALASPTPEGGDGIAQYLSFSEPSPSPSPKPTPAPMSGLTPGKTNGYTRFIVQCEYVNLSGPTPLDVYVGPATSPSQPYGKLVGSMHVVNGTASLLLTTARAPFVTKGTTVTIMTRQGSMVMTGKF
jgi:hypothetical protein